MATGVRGPLEEYLRTSYRPDCDYVDGVVQERNLEKLDHSAVQTQLLVLFSSYRNIDIRALPSLRMRVSERRYRIPDVAVVLGKPGEQVLKTPPLLCIEVLSKDDTVSRMNERVGDYLNFGVPVVWVVDPAERSPTIHRRSGLERATGSSTKPQ